MTLPVRDPVLVFALLMLALLVAPAAAQRARLPGVVGLIGAGVLLGPSALGVLDRSETIETLGTLGLLYLMFTAGLSLDLPQFNALRGRSAMFGLLSFGIPQVLATGMALLIGMGWLPALLMGSICGTHTLIALPTAERLGLGRHPAVTVTAGATLVTDMLGLVVLAVVAAVTQGAAGALFWVLFTTKLVGFVGFVLFVVPRLGRWVLRHMSLGPSTELTFLLLVLFGCSYLAALAGLAPIVGAFLAGLTLNRMVPAGSGIMGRVTFVGEALFVPFFLVSVGMLVDLGSLGRGGGTWALVSLFTLVIWGGKLLAAWVGARTLFGRFGAPGWIMFGLSTPQAAGTLAVTLVGFDLGLFDAAVVNAIIVIIMVTCTAGPWTVDRAGRAVALHDDASVVPLAAETPRILIPLANPHTSAELVELAIVLREPGAPDPIHPLTVVRDGSDVQEQVARSERLLAEAVLHAVAAGAPVQPATRVDLNVVHGISRAVKELRTSLLVIGWSGEALAGDRIFGGVLDQLLQECREMVIVCKTVAPANTTERVVLVLPRHTPRLVGFDRAVHAAKTLARNLSGELLVVACRAEAERVQERLAALRPIVPFSVEAVEDWEPEDPEAADRLPLALGPLLGPHDLLFLVGAREATLAWGPALARLPARLSSAFPGHTLLVAHPAEAESASSGRLPSMRAEPPPDVVVQPTATTRLRRPEELDALLLRLLEPELGGQPEALNDLLQRLAEGGAHEVRPGIVFLHAHAGCWPEARVFVGESAEGVTIPGHDEPARAVVLVVSRWGRPPEVHLKNLAIVGRAALRLDLDQLRQARTITDLAASLGE